MTKNTEVEVEVEVEKTSDTEMHEKPYWVVIGASAGGLEALKELLTSLDSSIPAIFIIAQHLDPKHPTILKDLLARVSSMPVELVTTNTEPVVNTIYIVSPGHNAEVKQGKILLSPAASIGPKPSINLLLNSLAEEVEEKAIAVILSGTGSDGAQGAASIKANAGLIIVQDEETAKYASMPNSAIETGFVDLVLPPKKIAEELKSYIQSSGQIQSKLAIDKSLTSLQKLFKCLLDETGYDFSGYKLKTVQRRIARRMAVHKLTLIEDYVLLTTSSPTEADRLFKDLLISVTDFFRDPDAFKSLEMVIYKLVEKHNMTEPIRVWVVGCANGEEAYSISILFQKARLALRKEISYQVFATDIDEYALTQARKATFSKNQVKNIDAEILEDYFYQKDGIYTVKKTVRDHVVFARQNVVMDPPFARLDLVSCRNVMIYFSVDLQRQVLRIFHFALKMHGYLFLGKAESASSVTPELFDDYDKANQVFQRKQTSMSRQLDHLSSAVSVSRGRKLREKEKVMPSLLQEKNRLIGQLDQALLDQLIPTAVVIDDLGQVIHIRGDVSGYLSFPQGRIDTNILTLVSDELKVDVRSLMQKAKKEGSATTQALFYKKTVATVALFLSVQRLSVEGAQQDLYVLTFTKIDLSEAFVSGSGLVDGKEGISNESLRQEVSIFKERLQTAVEELETTNEELQSTNEEMQSSNEELQSANEELQTSNEELQSTNEELSTVNQELEVKSFELEQVNNDLEAMLKMMHEPIMMVDNRLRLQRFTQAASLIFNLTVQDIGQIITTLDLGVEVTNFRQELLNVIESNTVHELEIRQKKQRYCVRLSPYKTDAVSQVGVMIFVEKVRVTLEIKDQQQKEWQPYELFGKVLPFSQIVIDDKGIIVDANEKTTELLGYSQQELLYQNIKMIMPNPYSQHHDDYIRDYLHGNSAGSMCMWRDVTALTKSEQRLLLKLYVEPIFLKGQQHFIGFLTKPEMLDVLQ